MENKLEEIKRMGNYSVICWFGGEIGLDDIDTPLEERIIQITFYPIGYMAGLKCFWKGDFKTFKTFDFKTKPKKVSNPPTSKEVEKDGYYIWGDKVAVNKYLRKRR